MDILKVLIKQQASICSYKKYRTKVEGMKRKAKQSIDQSLISTPKRFELILWNWNILLRNEKLRSNIMYTSNFIFVSIETREGW